MGKEEKSSGFGEFINPFRAANSADAAIGKSAVYGLVGAGLILTSFGLDSGADKILQDHLVIAQIYRETAILMRCISAPVFLAMLVHAGTAHHINRVSEANSKR